MGGLTAKQIAENISVLTKKSQALQTPAASINLLNGALLGVGQGPFPQILVGLTDIVSTVSNDINNLQGTTITKDADAKAIGSAFGEFTQAHQRLLNILISKAGVLQSTITVVGQPVVAVLRQDESVIDTIAYTLIDSIKVKAVSDEISGYQNTLNSALTEALSVYSGLRN